MRDPAPQPVPPERIEPINVLDREFGTLIRRSQRGAARVSERVHPSLDAAAYPLLMHIADNPLVRPSDLAHHFGIGRATTSRQVTRLVNLGLVERTVDPEDCRMQGLRLTQDGRTRLLNAQARRWDWYHRVLADWTTSDLETFGGLLTRFAQVLEDAPVREETPVPDATPQEA